MDALVDDFDVIESLTMSMGQCVDVPAASGSLLADVDPKLHVVATSSETDDVLELSDPDRACFDAFRFGRPVIQGYVGSLVPWPRFGRMAMQAGLPSVYALRCGSVTPSSAPLTC